MRLSLAPWRLMLLAALVLLAAAMGDSALGRAMAAAARGPASGCEPGPLDCGVQVSAPAQMALVQGSYRPDGKPAPFPQGPVPVALPPAGPWLTVPGTDRQDLSCPADGPVRPTQGLCGQPRGPPSDA
ncbi:hypothetical protein [Niveispirillum fermenti]|uniref:hypothetical protein n=1 Tax=Niveispirillum fermenti TaxID=1233113 RepID=UPI003A8AC098